MNLLFIGGTRFVGRAMGQEALQRGHTVTLFHRGSTPVEDTGVKELLGDRNTDRSALAGGQWDAVIDTCAYRPHEVHNMRDALRGKVGKYVLISSVSVYADDIAINATESAARHATQGLDGQDLTTVPIDATTYGPLKVLCEDALTSGHADHLLVRPTYVIGPYDYTMRFPHWVRLIAAGGVVNVPGPHDEPLRYIDARDLAAFVVGAIERNACGAFSVAAADSRWTFGNTMDTIVSAVGPAGTELRWMGVEEATASGKTLPLWSGGTYPRAHTIDCSAAISAGLRCRPLGETVMDVQQWLRQCAVDLLHAGV